MFVRYVLSGALTLTGLMSSLVFPLTSFAQTAAPSSGQQSGGSAVHPGADARGGRTTDGTRDGGDRTGADRQDPAARAEDAMHAGDAMRPASGPTGSAAATSAQSPASAAARRIFQGTGFDTCQAPDLATMDAWRTHSDYRAVGIYFGGRARACSSQKNLTSDWVRRTTTAGWNLLPIYVGSQSPCVSGTNKNPYRIDSSAPGAQGTREGKDAVSAAQTLSLKPGSALYLDMEAYTISNTSCAATTLTYVQAWNRQVRAAGYVTGFYSSADSGIRHMDAARRAGAADLPDVLWYARWGVTPNLVHEPSVADTAWTPHARIHQYSGSVTESHGGRSLSIDRNVVDAPVAVVG